MTETRRLLFVLGCIVCLLAVASALPAADPRLETPGGGENATAPGSWETVADPPDPADAVTGSPGAETGENDSDESDTDGPDRPIEISDDVEPGSDATVRIDDASHFDERTVEVDGEYAGRTDSFGRASIAVPYTDEMNVTVPEIDQSRTVDVETNATIEHEIGAAPDRELEIAAAVGSTPVAEGTVFLEGESVATTGENGTATVTLPETAGPADLRVERGPVEGERTVDVAEPDVEFTSPLVLPGSPAPVQVSADGVGVQDAAVSLDSGGEDVTGDDGAARVWLPIDDEATVTVDVGAETATATIGNLYLRLTALVVLVPGLVVGAAVTYVRFAAARERRRRAVLSELFVGLAGSLAGLLAGFGRPSLPRPDWSLSLPRSGISPPSMALSLPSPAPLTGAMSSLGSLSWSWSSSSERSVRSLFDRSTDTDTESESEDDDGTRAADDESDGDDADSRSPFAADPLEPRRPRAEVRAAWHAVLDRLELENRETRTPGEVARSALAAGYPASSFRRLVTIVRDLEYGDREPSPDRVASARAAAADVIEYDHEHGRDHDHDADPDEEGSAE